MLTWKSNKGLIYDLDSFKKLENLNIRLKDGVINL